jgi:hypothetical protein
MVSQVVHLELRPENLPDFCGLIRIARGKQKLDHNSNESGNRESESKF